MAKKAAKQETAGPKITITGMHHDTREGLEGVVYLVLYYASNEDESVRIPGSAALGPPKPEDFVPFEQLTDPAVVVEWVRAYLGDAGLADLDKDLKMMEEAKAKPAKKVVEGDALPWAKKEG